ncbi:hypothetical protein [Roseivivax sp. THAF197b]|uniref:hypothetical protein n=1 Tax=Roseivivax sp. THAF197b TaxID=2588299 RepID=UPI001268331E|nr:hypothetical protein [Roseivivax sp. THAF197b]QFS84809.1 hypothetical protein FIV09_18360 [Roseivivax sp. THAF197b]
MAKPPNASPRTRGTGRDPAQNARRHGLTAPACPNDALAHYRLILGNARRTRASYATDEVDRLAYMLAEAEARVERATAAERAHLFGRFSHAGIQAQGGDVFEPVAEDVLSVEVLRQIVLSDGPDIAQRVAAAQESAFWRRADLLARYRREAETARRRTLCAYARALEAEDPAPRLRQRAAQ